MESVEASGRSIEDAILQALARLGRNRDEVTITVLQEPTRGVRGMGTREARVRVFVKPERAEAPPEYTAYEPVQGADESEFVEGEYPDDEFAEDTQQTPDGVYTDGDDVPAPYTGALRTAFPEDASIEEIAVAALELVLAHMGVQAEVEVRPEEHEEEPLTLDIRSLTDEPLSLLIGRRGETLAALQLLVNLMVAKQTDERERIILDIEGYRERREENLRALAQRVAQQVRQSGQPMVLEAMPPNERRIVHMALAESADVSTESTGEGDQRRVVISPVKARR